MRTFLLLLLACSTGFCNDAALIFNQKCAACHRAGSGTRAPVPEVLYQMSRRSILSALETGLMKTQGAGLPPTERALVAAYRGPPDVSSVEPSAGGCTAAPEPLSGLAGWNGWGADISNSRFQSAAAGGIAPSQVPNMKLKWAFGFP